MLNRRPRRQINQMNVVPYIDVMLVLLVIFMVTTPMFTPGLVDVPSVSQARARIPDKPLQVLIDKDGSYALKDDGLPQESFASLEQLISRVVEKGGARERTVAVEANKELQYQKVMDVADKLHAAGIKRLAFTVSQKSGGQ